MQNEEENRPAEMTFHCKFSILPWRPPCRQKPGDLRLFGQEQANQARHAKQEEGDEDSIQRAEP